MERKIESNIYIPQEYVLSIINKLRKANWTDKMDVLDILENRIQNPLESMKVSADYSGRTEKFCIDADTRSAGSVRFNVVKNWYKVSVVVTVKETDGTCISVQVKDFDVKAETEEIAKDIATADAVKSVADFAAAGCIIETEYCWAKKIMEGI